MLAQVFNQYLNWLANKFNIRDISLRTWHFQSHQFRHSVGTKMINNNVPHHIIQRYLGHTSPMMTSVYAHIMDSTLKKQIDNYHNRVVNITGEVIKSSKVGLFRKALESGWMPSQLDEERETNQLEAIFSEWYKQALASGLVIASQKTKEGIIVYEPTGQAIPFETMLERGWTLDYLQQRNQP